MKIGIAGFAGAGKTEVALHIERNYGFHRLHIAEPLRRMLRTFLAEYGIIGALADRYLTGDLKETVIPEIGVTSRHLQISLGTAWGREAVDQALWAKLWGIHAAKYPLVMNDSVRFRNEAAMVDLLIMVVRPGTEPVAYKWGGFGRSLYHYFGVMSGVHDSERIDRLRPNIVIINDGSLHDLFSRVDSILHQVGIR